MQDLNVRSMLLGTPVRLRHTTRYSTCRVTHPESVAEHSYYVALYAMLMAHALNGYGPEDNINMSSVAVRSILHDIEESVTGDIPRSFKYRNSSLRNELKLAAISAFDEVFDDVIPAGYEVGLKNVWMHSKDDSREGRIVRFADFVAIVGYVVQEVRAGNNTLNEHVSTIEEYMETFYSDEYDFMRPFVDQTEAIIREELTRCFEPKT